MYCSNCGKKLKDNIYTCSKCGFESPNPKKHSNKISITKYIFYSIISFNLYPLIWVYRSWVYIKAKQNLEKISPFWRTFFMIFYLYSLLKRIKELAQEQGVDASFSPGWRTFFFIIFNMVENRYDRVAPQAFPIYASFLFLLRPVEVMNNYYDKVEENTIEKPTEWWHYILIAFGVLMWIAIIFA